MVITCNKNKIVLIKRKNPPYKNHWALPGGFVEYGENVEFAALREAKEETGLEVKLTNILNVYSNPNRDPRGHVVSICYLAQRVGGILKADSDAAEVKCLRQDKFSTLNLAFDHKKILEEATKKLSSSSKEFESHI